MAKGFFRDPLLQRLVSGALFAGVFIWVAVRFFDVDPEFIRVLVILSFLMVAVLMVAGLLLLPVFIWRLRRRRRFFMRDLSAGEDKDGK